MGTQRIWEIDFLRGIAIVFMVVFHINYDLAVFFGYQLEYAGGFWFFTGRATAALFIVLSGISSNFSTGVFRRCGNVLAAAVLVSAATYFFDPLLYVRFGILHLLGVCMAVAAIFHKLGKKTVSTATTTTVGIFILWVMFRLQPSVVTASFFIPLGITPPGFESMDYYPLIPWAGLFFGGLVLGNFLYGEKKSLGLAGFALLPPVKAVCFLGRHSLLVYLLHQPVILPVLYFIHQF